MSLRSINGGISFLHLQEDDHDLFHDQIWSHHDLSVEITTQNDVVSRNNQVNFVMDMFQQRVEKSNIMGSDEIVSIIVNEETFGVIDRNCDVGRHPLGLELGLGFVDREDGDYEDDCCNFGGFAASDCGDDFYIARRRDKGSRECNEGSSRGVRTVWIESDSDDEVEGIDNVLLGLNVGSDDEESFGVDNVNDDGDLSVTLCWDSFHLEDEDNVEVNNNHDFEWEEVDDDDVVVERDVLSFAVDNVDEEERLDSPEEEVERGSRVSNSEWEVLLNRLIVNHRLDRNVDVEEDEDEGGPYYGDHDDYIYTDEYETMFGQFADGESAILGRPPASKAAIEKLPLVVITEKDVVDEKSLCAVCKDHIEVGEEGKKLPCSHLYHGDCIIPWLGIRNTCPVCRFELPTDDLDYEQKKTRLKCKHIGLFKSGFVAYQVVSSISKIMGPPEVVTLYRSLLRTARKFPDYNIREYVKRRTMDAFRLNKTLDDPSAISSAVADARSQLEIAKRQAVVYSLYAPKVKSIMEIGNN
ncbi:hypothetical protein KSS87_017548 [Heliosperma pusillum]|nr:hypothetical protein KSS87_017548 [Heliosperma pusillum]